MPASIMVANDSQTILALFQEILVEEGYNVHLRLLAQHDMQQEIETVKPDLLIVDCSKGKKGPGWQLLQQLRLHRTTERLPIVICSTEYNLFDEMHDFLVAKRIVSLPKPFDIDDLLQAIQQAFGANKLASDQAGDSAGTFAQIGL